MKLVFYFIFYIIKLNCVIELNIRKENTRGGKRMCLGKDKRKGDVWNYIEMKICVLKMGFVKF